MMPALLGSMMLPLRGLYDASAEWQYDASAEWQYDASGRGMQAMPLSRMQEWSAGCGAHKAIIRAKAAAERRRGTQAKPLSRMRRQYDASAKWQYDASAKWQYDASAKWQHDASGRATQAMPLSRMHGWSAGYRAHEAIKAKRQPSAGEACKPSLFERSAKERRWLIKHARLSELSGSRAQARHTGQAVERSARERRWLIKHARLSELSGSRAQARHTGQAVEQNTKAVRCQR